ncbi:NTF2 fold immunity protein [Flavobacterium sp. WC2509]|uniref:NTF2 fold immunity protein n=1 Tax=Flavobacterium sp. WC2509 TaxID=3461406 RepID=UPI004044637C
MKYLFFIILLFSLNCNSQNKNNILEREYAKRELKNALQYPKFDNRIDNKTNIITDSIIAIKVAEPVLFNLYGKEHIEKQKPYEIIFVENYWIIFGTNKSNGNFLIIIDARNSKIIRIAHGEYFED